MFKIDLNTKILNIKGKPLKTPIYDDKGKKTGDKDSVLRDSLLLVLGSRFVMLDNKEAFWTTGLGILIADEKNKEIEISDNKRKFLKRIMENNKIKMNVAGGGEREVEVFFPYELSQILGALMTPEELMEIE